MYKFKKSKNVHFDHIYTHPMFKSGRIDLLRDIQRKTAEITNLTPVDSQSFKNDDDEIDVDTLIQENMHFKRVHKELINHVELIESKMKNIRSEVSMLHNEQIKADANEQFLKNILKSLTKVYGFETIAKIIETDVEENSAIPSMNVQQSNVEEYSGEMSSDDNSSQVPESNYEDEKCSQFSHEYQLSENFSTHDTPQLSENIHQCNKDDSMIQQPLFLLDFGLGSNFNNGYGENAEASPKLSKANSYRIWVDELKNMEYNAEMFHSLTNQRFVGGLNIEDF